MACIIAHTHIRPALPVKYMHACHAPYNQKAYFCAPPPDLLTAAQPLSFVVSFAHLPPGSCHDNLNLAAECLALLVIPSRGIAEFDEMPEHFQ